MFREIFQTDNTTGFMFLRLSLGIVMFFHGAQKALGWFGGPGYEKTISIFTSQYGFPFVIAVLIIAIEFIGSIGLIVGFFTRIAAVAIAINIGVCAYLNHLQNGFFMNWFGKQAGEGYEYHILVLGICFALIVKGAGALSFDRLFSRKD
ncbi:putative oxidoreductase MhqP [bacterium BMS3Abin07]|nr:putative oxidoreductase MhqP [bacterium BMS3Abin07]GBE33402.1 putative oxidoreductase MhqP [bacterium BMS3Bbin05]